MKIYDKKKEKYNSKLDIEWIVKTFHSWLGQKRQGQTYNHNHVNSYLWAHCATKLGQIIHNEWHTVQNCCYWNIKIIILESLLSHSTKNQSLQYFVGWDEFGTFELGQNLKKKKPFTSTSSSGCTTTFQSFTETRSTKYGLVRFGPSAKTFFLQSHGIQWNLSNGIS